MRSCVLITIPDLLVSPTSISQCTQTTIDASADLKYIKTYCWAHGTYDVHTQKHIYYYQWIPIIFAVQVGISIYLVRPQKVRFGNKTGSWQIYVQCPMVRNNQESRHTGPLNHPFAYPLALLFHLSILLALFYAYLFAHSFTPELVGK